MTVAVLTGTAAVAYGAGAFDSSNPTINACVTKASGAVRVVVAPGACKPSEYPLSWNVQGPPGTAAAGALVQTDTYQTGPDDDPLHLPVGVDQTLVTLPKPDNGTSGAWNQAVVTATINIGSPFGTTTGIVNCIVPGGTAMVFSVQPNVIYSQNFTTGYHGNGPNIQLICQVQDKGPSTPDIWVGWATLSAVPAAYNNGINH